MESEGFFFLSSLPIACMRWVLPRSVPPWMKSGLLPGRPGLATTALAAAMAKLLEGPLTNSSNVNSSFSGSVETAREMLRFHPNFYIGIGGVLTFKKSNLPETVKEIPLERIVLETDSPYMAPTPMRGKRNEPSFIPYIINRLAEAKGITPRQVSEITTANAMRLFFGK